MINKNTLLKVLSTQYNFTPKIMTKSAWGYNTVAYYTEVGNERYVVKVSDTNTHSLARVNRDIYLSEKLSNLLPTSSFVKNQSGSYIALNKNYVIRVAKFIPGAMPFKITFEIYKQIIDTLHFLHTLTLSDLDLDIELPVMEGGANFLHGDLTPSNIIVAEEKIVGVVDFEDSLLGPIEYDLSRSAVFGWYRTEGIPFKEFFDQTLILYKEKVDTEKMYNYCLKNAQTDLKRVEEHRSYYKNQAFWQDDFEFASKAYKEIKSAKI